MVESFRRILNFRVKFLMTLRILNNKKLVSMSISQIFTFTNVFLYIHDRKILHEIFSRGGFLEIFSY